MIITKPIRAFLEPVMTPEELQQEYALSARPYIETTGPVPWNNYLGMRSWRYVLEISSMCNLRCTLCHAGNREGYEYKSGIMEMDLFHRIVDKIQTENPDAIVCCYVNSEPFLHPHLADCIRYIRGKGLKCEVATNLNYMVDVDAVLAAQPTLFSVSVSGWSQEVYQRAHKGGDVEKVKRHMKELSEAYKRGGYTFPFGLSYHKYNDNQGDEEMGEMRRYAESLGYMFMISWGRVICIENTVQALRQIEGRTEPYEIKDGMNLNEMLPPAKPEFIEGMERLKFHPKNAMKFYDRWPVSKVCLISEVFTEIRHDGRVQLCAWTDDMRLTLGNYLDMTIQQIAEARRGNPLCKECLRYRLNYYFHITDSENW